MELTIQCRLLGEPELTYKSAFELAQSMETAEQNTSDLQAASSRSEPRNKPEDFHYTPRSPSQPRTPPHFICYHCGGNHKTPDCKYKDAICNSCKKKAKSMSWRSSQYRSSKEPEAAPAASQFTITCSASKEGHLDHKDSPPGCRLR